MVSFMHDSKLKLNQTWHRVGDGGVVMLKCPNGHIGVLEDHEIAVDGRVNPSVVCPHEGCDFHDMIELMGWRADGPELVYNP